MPELPEVETVCRGLETAMTGKVIVQADLHRAGLRRAFPKNLAQHVAGAKVLRIARRAKYILVYLNNDHVLVMHLGMSGRIMICDRNYQPQKHDHMVLHLRGGVIVVFNDARRFGVVDLVSVKDMETHAMFAKLGPEPLERDFSGPILAQRLKNKKTSIKAALMDQSIVVGVGNIYASEALFMAGISPTVLAGKVKGARAGKLVAAIKTVLDKAIKSGGSTLRDHRQTNGELGYFQHHFSVYDREGRACPGCHCDIGKTKGIKRIIQGGRSTFYCPRKQV